MEFTPTGLILEHQRSQHNWGRWGVKVEILRRGKKKCFLRSRSSKSSESHKCLQCHHRDEEPSGGGVIPLPLWKTQIPCDVQYAAKLLTALVYQGHLLNELAPSDNNKNTEVPPGAILALLPFFSFHFVHQLCFWTPFSAFLLTLFFQEVMTSYTNTRTHTLTQAHQSAQSILCFLPCSVSELVSSAAWPQCSSALPLAVVMCSESVSFPANRCPHFDVKHQRVSDTRGCLHRGQHRKEETNRVRPQNRIKKWTTLEPLASESFES